MTSVSVDAGKVVSVFGTGFLAEAFSEGASFLVLEDIFANASGHVCSDTRPSALVSFQEFVPKDFEGDSFVAGLASFGLAHDDHAGGAMAQAYGRFAPIDVLTAWTARSKGFHVALGQEGFIG